MPTQSDRDDLHTAGIVVNYGTPDLAVRAVHSILAEPGVRELVVVDNGSTAESAAALRAALPEDAKLIESRANVGFGRGVNLAARECTADFLFLLNSDAIIRPGSLNRLANVLRERPQVAAVAPAIYLPGDGDLQPAAYGAFPTVIGVLTRRRPRETRAPDWISGVAMLLRRSDFEAVGGFDPDFAMYLEDVDLCRRFRGMGKEVRRELTASVEHLGGKSWQDPNEQWRRARASRVIYARKAGFSIPGRIVVRLLQALHLGLQAAPSSRRRGER